MPAIQSITDGVLVGAIASASQRVVFVAPGVWPDVAEAIAAAWKRLSPESVSVILDVDAEICRMGYGSAPALQVLQAAAKQVGESIGHEPGVRICVLIADDETIVFSPTARLIESQPGDEGSPSTSHPRANGIVLSKSPEQLKEDLGAGEEGAATRVIGLDPVKEEKVAEVAKDIERNPPKEFDLARAVNVYNAAIRFVELKVSGYRLGQHKVALPRDLVRIARENKVLSGKIDAALHLLDDQDQLVAGKGVSQESVEKTRQGLEERYLRPIKGIGRIIRRDEIPAFLKDLEALKTELESFSEEVRNVLAERYRAIADELATALLPSVREEIPEPWRRTLGNSPDSEHLRFKILEALLKAFGDPDRKVKAMTISLVYKDVTYDMLKEGSFREAVQEHFPDLDPFKERYTALREREKPPETDLFLE